MKIRSGFVSNSSSSSFIMNAKASTTAQVAIIMMYQMKYEWTTRDWWGDYETPQEFSDALAWLEENEDFNGPIMLPWSCNYESFIWVDGDNIYIDTCNNHDWSILGAGYHGDGFYGESDGIPFLNMSIMKRQTPKEFRDALIKEIEIARKGRENENT